jgi:hypothetical protein
MSFQENSRRTPEDALTFLFAKFPPKNSPWTLEVIFDSTIFFIRNCFLLLYCIGIGHWYGLDIL